LTNVQTRPLRRLQRYIFWGNSLTDDSVGRCIFLAIRLLVFWPLSLVVSLVLGLVSLWRPVNLLIMRCNRSKISFVIEDLEFELRIQAHDRKLMVGLRQPLNFAVLDTMPPNEALTNAYGRATRLYHAKHWLLMPIFRYVLPLARTRRVYMPNKRSDRIGVWAAEQPITRLTDADTLYGEELLRTLGLDPAKPFVCYALASSSYVKMLELRDHPPPAALVIVEPAPNEHTLVSGIRTGLPVDTPIVRIGQALEPLSSDLRDLVVDYSSVRTDIGDLFLAHNCHFMIAGGDVGAWWLSAMANRPVLVTDRYGLSTTTSGNDDLFLPMIPLNRRTSEPLPISWIIAHPEWGQRREILENINLRHNTCNEIAAVVREMWQRLSGEWVPPAGHEQRRLALQSLLAVQPAWRVRADSNMGAEFLRDHEDLIR
jgi:putative glycosyltransferase (TIGR04372 family)